MAALQRVLNHRVSIGALIEVALWLAIPYLCIGFVWSSLHGEQVQQIQTRLEKLSPVGADLLAFGLTTALWPASLQIADACPASG
jgi:hypothetical protein